MISYIWPIALVVCSNIIYNICAKSVPDAVNPFAALVVTYLIGAAASAAMYFIFGKGGNIFKEFSQLNWAPFVLGIVIVGLESGYTYAYKNGWQVSTAPIVQSSFLAVALLFVGFFLYKEPLSAKKIIGMIVCLVGLFIINI